MTIIDIIALIVTTKISLGTLVTLEKKAKDIPNFCVNNKQLGKNEDGKWEYPLLLKSKYKKPLQEERHFLIELIDT